jgi:hypothetical protein
VKFVIKSLSLDWAVAISLLTDSMRALDASI